MITRTVVNAAVAALAASVMMSLTANADDTEILERVKPAGNLIILETTETAIAAGTAANTEPAVATSASETADARKATYTTACFACHGTGAAGAPVVGNKDAWAMRVGQGKEALYSHAIKGFKAMPPKGGATTLSDDVVKAVVDYMVEQSS
ncbi:MAG: c-type cytochrome [Arenicellales bacterium]